MSPIRIFIFNSFDKISRIILVMQPEEKKSLIMWKYENRGDVLQSQLEMNDLGASWKEILW